MATIYTSNLKLGKPAVADRNWNLPLNSNADQLDALAPIGGLCVTCAELPSCSTSVRVSAGKFQMRDGTVAAFPGAASLALPPTQTSSLFLTESGTLVASPVGYPQTSHVRLATVATGASAVLNISDERVVCFMTGTDALPFLPAGGGTLADGSNLALGTASGSQIATSISQKLGFWGAAPVSRPAPYTQVYTTTTRTITDYFPIVESNIFVGTSNAQSGTPYAQVGDLNNLRVAHENLRILSENVAQIVGALIDDLRSMGLIG